MKELGVLTLLLFGVRGKQVVETLQYGVNLELILTTLSKTEHWLYFLVSESQRIYTNLLRNLFSNSYKEENLIFICSVQRCVLNDSRANKNNKLRIFHFDLNEKIKERIMDW